MSKRAKPSSTNGFNTRPTINGAAWLSARFLNPCSAALRRYRNSGFTVLEIKPFIAHQGLAFLEATHF